MESNLTLLPFQQSAVEKVITKFSGKALIAYEMGLGKTAIACTVAKLYNNFPVVVVCPASLRINWKREILMWCPGVLESEICVVLNGKVNLFANNFKFYIFSYELASASNIEIASLAPSLIILDESHYIKNRTSKRSKQIVPLCRQTPRCLLLTGTPVLNRPEELWSQLEALNFHLGSFFQFAIKYCNAHRKIINRRGKTVWDTKGSSNIADLNQKLISNIMVRKLKSDSDVEIQLPDKRRQVIYLEGVGKSKVLQTLYSDCSSALKRCNGSIDGAMAMLKKLELNVGDNVLKAYSEVSALKVNAVSEIVVNTSQQVPLVVFYHHRSFGDVLSKNLGDENISFSRIDGKTSTENRQQIVDDFQSGKLQTLLLSITAASTGLTLTRAQDMIIAELPWSPGVAMQAEDRIHRIGQKNSVLIRYLLAEKTIDELMWKLMYRKSAISHGILDGKQQSDFSTATIDYSGGYWELIQSILTELKLTNNFSLEKFL